MLATVLCCLSSASIFPTSSQQSSGPCAMVAMCNRKAVIKNADLSEDVHQDSVECTAQVLEKHSTEKHPVVLSKEFDKKYNCAGRW